MTIKCIVSLAGRTLRSNVAACNPKVLVCACLQGMFKLAIVE